MTGRIDVECDVLVIGGGAAGITAAMELSGAGLSVRLAEQRASLGGAYFRQRADGAASAENPARARAWVRLMARLSASSVKLQFRHVYLGLDRDGVAMLDDRSARRVVGVRPRAVVLAVGALEKVTPRTGWQLDGVTTAGGLQMLLKETGAAPSGDILIAGNGPLNIALAADLARIGRPAVAVVEAGDPTAQWGAVLGLVGHPGLLAEAASHLGRVLASGTPWLRGTTLVGIDRQGGKLVATLRDRQGKVSSRTADLIALHDGIRPNDFGLPSTSGADLVVARTGDCREALGIRAALADGRAVAQTIIGRLSGDAKSPSSREVSRQRRAQALLRDMFEPVARLAPLTGIADETVICRCEGRTAGDLRGLLAGSDQPTLREIKLNGRFCMGVCQGRFCADNVRALVAAARPQSVHPTSAFGRDRWPIKPVSIASLIAEDKTQGQP